MVSSLTKLRSALSQFGTFTQDSGGRLGTVESKMDSALTSCGKAVDRLRKSKGKLTRNQRDQISALLSHLAELRACVTSLGLLKTGHETATTVVNNGTKNIDQLQNAIATSKTAVLTQLHARATMRSHNTSRNSWILSRGSQHILMDLGDVE